MIFVKKKERKSPWTFFLTLVNTVTSLESDPWDERLGELFLHSGHVFLDGNISCATQFHVQPMQLPIKVTGSRSNV
jgi:hypothetical protein